MADRKNERRGLGRGLSALMADVEPEQSSGHTQERRAELSIPIDKVHPNPDQPRRIFVEESLEELAASIARKGIIQPLILRRHPALPEEYQIVAGERRWRAAQMAQIHEVPAIVRDFDDTEVLEVAIIENIQRSDLNPVDEAAGYRQLMDRFGRTQEQMADALGKSRSHIANTLRLLNLPEQVQQLLATGKLTAGHARALITAEDPAALAAQVVSKGLSVRETEALAKGPKAKAKSVGRSSSPEKDADTRALEQDLSANLGMKVSVDHKPDREDGVVTISYKSLEDLDNLCRILSGGYGD
ncbi:ParB/RepB/Spo0J family partition protein [Maribius pontilimi]|uniref:ParB/RepB/Spo0J family partition protein n=1 Tax=Palleronia pontilimi TaxID=1964209 RepID=A0A934MBI7_9RHOB|nr:ParB/RepB/Spo0J family partition protein [Palleronia pontilimi]MBJ3761550.1 ParB/RepB/Spo0J family partition protein [Palleronia pontilimi]